MVTVYWDLDRIPVSFFNSFIMVKFVRQRFLPVFAAALVALSALPASAQEQPATDAGLFPPQESAEAPEYELPPGADTHPMIRLTPEKSEIINLDTEIKSLIIGNPLHLNVIMDTTKRLVLVPRTPGATSFTALDETGKVIMQRHVIVNGPEEKYVRIRRSCGVAGPSGNCERMSVYYCPEGPCHPVSMVTSTVGLSSSGNRAISPASGGGSGGVGGLGQSDVGTLNENFNESETVNPFELLMRALQNGSGQTETPTEE